MALTTVHDLDLPEIDVLGLDRPALLDALDGARSEHWLARTPLGYVLMDYGDVTAILRDQRFQSALSVLPSMSGIDGPLRERQQRSILAMEGAEHQRVRSLVAPAFTPRATDRLRPFMRQVINELIDPVAQRGTCEFVTEVCEPYPIPIICELLGAPRRDWKLFSRWATAVFRIFNNDVAHDLPVIEAAMVELDQYVTDMVEARRGQPGEDLLSRMIAVEEQGDRLSTQELIMMSEAVLLAGTDTTRNQLACAIALLAQRPEQWSLLADDPTLVPQAVEELMRHLGTVRLTLRLAAEDVDYRDVTFPAGTLLVLSLAAANHDPAVWSEPQRFDIQRRSAGSPQMTFGSGIHYCLGASLARAELQEALGVLAQRLPDLELAEPVEWKPPAVGIWGPERLVLSFRASG